MAIAPKKVREEEKENAPAIVLSSDEEEEEDITPFLNAELSPAERKGLPEGVPNILARIYVEVRGSPLRKLIFDTEEYISDEV